MVKVCEMGREYFHPKEMTMRWNLIDEIRSNDRMMEAEY